MKSERYLSIKQACIRQGNKNNMNKNSNSLCSKVQFLSGAWLKRIAILSMLIDHVIKALIYPNLVPNDGLLTGVSDLFDIIGRIAFPLFCFMLVKDVVNVTRDEDGITTMSIYDFLLKENSLEL